MSSGIRLLDCAIIERLRLSRGLSRHAVARQLGTSPTTIRLLEDGTNHDVLNLRFVVRLAAVLGTSPSHLFSEDVAATSREEAAQTQREGEETPDDVRVEVALAHVGHAVRREQLCAAFGWDMRRTSRALAALQQRLSSGGQQLVRHGPSYLLRPRAGVLKDDEIQGLTRARWSRTGMRRDAAMLLAAVARGEVGSGWERAAGANGRVLMASLLDGGLVRRDGDGYTLSADVRDGLLMDPGAGRGSSRRPRERPDRRK